MLLAAARSGDREAYDRVFARVYDQLRRVASRQAARFGRDATLTTTAVVHEAYVKLTADKLVAGNDRAHFFALAARAMRQILARLEQVQRTLTSASSPDPELISRVRTALAGL